MVEDTKGIIRIRASKKDRQHNGQNKKERQHNGQNKKDKWTNNDLQNTKQETKDQETRIPLNTWGGDSDAPEGKSVSALLVIPVVLLDLQSRIYDIGYKLAILYTAW